MEAVEWASDFTERIHIALGKAELKFRSYLGQHFIEVPDAGILFDLISYLNQAEQFDMLVDLTAVDYPQNPQRFEVVHFLYSFARNQRIRVKAHLALDQPIRSVTEIFGAANWLEREVFDMFGIAFTGHPDLKRILLPEEWEGHPLRKEIGITAMDNNWVQQHLGIESGN
jgi:NADH-quinone oxidoreductase subunit C